MRPLELLLLFSLLVALLLRLRPPAAGRARWAKALSFLLLLIVALHLALESYRWQMVPAYLLATVLALSALIRARRPGRKALAVAGPLVGLVWLAVAAALPAALPVPRMPEPGGSYAVGTMTFYWRDEARAEIYSDNPADRRELMVQLWYPAEPANDGQPAPYIANLDIAAPAIAGRLGLPSFLLDHLNLVKTHAYPQAAVAGTGAPYPVLVFSHGLRGFRAQNSVLMEQLASHGYVVAAIDHTYGGIFTVFPDGRVAFYSPSVFPNDVITRDGGRRLVAVWAADARFVLDRLADANQNAAGPFAGQLDLARVGLLGHSTGGGTAVEACGQDGRCRAGVALDGWLEPVSDQVLQRSLAQPFLFVNTADWLGPENAAIGRAFYNQVTGEAYLVTINGAAHFDFSDLPLLSPLTEAMGLSGSLDGRRVVGLINEYVLAFFDRTLKGEVEPLLESAPVGNPEVSLESRR